MYNIFRIIYPLNDFSMVYFEPNSGLNLVHRELYLKNRRSLIRQVITFEDIELEKLFIFLQFTEGFS